MLYFQLKYEKKITTDNILAGSAKNMTFRKFNILDKLKNKTSYVFLLYLEKCYQLLHILKHTCKLMKKITKMSLII